MATETRPKLLLLDGHSLAYRAFFALPVDNFSTTTGQHTNAVYGFTAMLINLLRDENPTHLAVAFDVSRQTFRSEQYSDYKANRSSSPAEFQGQVSLIKEVLAALKITCLEKPGFEADDVIATLATAAADEYEVLVCSGDRDALQLVTDTTTVLYPMRGVTELARMTPAAVITKYGVTPAQYPDLAALVGETSDNLPGVPGVGPKTAAKWINSYQGLANVIDKADEIGGKVGDALRSHLTTVIRNRQLNALVDDLDLGVTPTELAVQAWDRQEVHTLFDSLEFRVLRERLFETLTSAEESYQPTFSLELSDQPDSVVAWLAKHTPPGSRAGVAVTGDWKWGTGNLTGIAIATADNAALWIDPAMLSEGIDRVLGDWFANREIEKAIHDAKGPILALSAHGWQLDGLASDTALAAYLARPDQRSYDLADLSMRYLKRELTASSDGADNGQLTLGLTDQVDREELALAARATLDLATAIESELLERGGTELLSTVELPLVNVLVGMEQTGIAVDVALLESLEAEFSDQVKSAASAAYQVIGKEINLSSPKQLQVVLFDELAMPKTKKTKTGYTTDAEALVTLYEKTEHPFLQHLLKHRDASRLRQTVEGLLKTVQPDGRIHTTFNQLIAATGRLSSTDPNLQNIPVRTEAGRRIREAFVVGDGYEAILTADYSQIEMRLMADLSTDDALIEAFRSGMDFHTVTAASVFFTEPDAVTAEMRAKIKAMNYGLAYGLSAYGLSQQLRISTSEAKMMMDEYFETFGGIRDYLSGVVEAARKDGYTETILGRRRYLPDLTSDNRQRREMAERMALNAPIQGSAADLIKVAMLNVDRALQTQNLKSRMLLQVHDELVFELAPGEEEQLIDLVRVEMAAAAKLSVPMEVSIGIGASWHEAAH